MRLTRSDVLLTLGCVTATACLTWIGGFGLPEFVFFSVMLTSLAFLSREGKRAWSRERAARREALEVVRVRPERIAEEAVRVERLRLSQDITAELQGMLEQVRVEAAESVDPEAAARRIHRRTRLASSELRRLLGLLRTVESGHEDVVVPRPRPTTRLPRWDVALAGAAGLLALVESIAYPRAEGLDLDRWRVALTVATAVAVVGRSFAPAQAALAAAAAVGLGMTSGYGVTAGFWMLITVTGLVWSTVGVSDAPARRTGAGLLFAGVLIISAQLHDRENAAATTVVVSVLVATALTVRVERGRAQRASRLTARHRSSLAEAAAVAVEADRAAFAREIHDSVSHAVGLIAVQAGAAEVSARRDPTTARQALALVAVAATEALADLDRLHPDASPPGRTPQDVEGLIARIRAAGTSVTVSGLDLLPAAGSDLIYRIVQEALTNVVRHGRGAAASVTVEVDATSLSVTIADNGPGPLTASAHGFGLVGLAERVKHAGGSLRTETRTGGGGGVCGFAVTATLPAHRTGVP